MGRLTDLAEAFVEGGIPEVASTLAALQPALDHIQHPALTRHPEGREKLKNTERELLARLNELHETANDYPGWASSQLERLIKILEFEAKIRDAAWVGRELLERWDANANQTWDPEELHNYNNEVRKLKDIAERDAFVARWYFMAPDNVYGPAALSKVTALAKLPNLLVRYGKDTGWVRLSDIVE